MAKQNKLQPIVTAILFAIALGMSLSAPSAYSAKVYKWIDDEGKISYRDKPPPAGSEGKVEVKDIDSDHNVMQPREPINSSTNAANPNKPGKSGSSTAGNDNDENEKQNELYLGIEEQSRLENIAAEKAASELAAAEKAAEVRAAAEKAAAEKAAAAKAVPPPPPTRFGRP